MMAQSRGALIRLANGLGEKGQQLQDELNILKHEFEMLLEQRNYYSNQTEYFGLVVRRLDENSTRYHRRGAQLVEAYELEQRATEELMRIYWAIGAKQQEMEITLARERELRSQADQIDSY